MKIFQHSDSEEWWLFGDIIIHTSNMYKQSDPFSFMHEEFTTLFHEGYLQFCFLDCKCVDMYKCFLNDILQYATY